ncbi:MAG: hypothetical protein U0T33_08715 [Bacteroidales bacterium]
MSSATFGQIIILIVYLPVIAAVGIEGKMFRPMAQVVTFALIGRQYYRSHGFRWRQHYSLIKVITKRTFSDRFMDALHRKFSPVINHALNLRWV